MGYRLKKASGLRRMELECDECGRKEIMAALTALKAYPYDVLPVEIKGETVNFACSPDWKRTEAGIYCENCGGKKQ